MNNGESKYYYTASLMNEALLQLLEKKDIDFITVTEITKKAGVGRSTFYLHYDNVYELFEEALENLNKRFVDSFKLERSVEIRSKKEAFLITAEYLVPYLEFCRKNKRVLKLAHQKPELFKNRKKYQKMYDLIFYPAISQFVSEEAEKIYMLEFFTQGVVGIINRWIERDCDTDILELMDIIIKCIGYADE